MLAVACTTSPVPTATPTHTPTAPPTAPPTPMPTNTPTPVPTATQPLTLQTYVRPGRIWQISYPAEWEVDEFLSRYDFDYVSFERSGHDLNLAVTWIADTALEYGNLESWSHALHESAKEKWQVVSWERGTLSEYPAYESIVNTGTHYEFSLILVVGTGGYMVAGWTPTERWGEDEALLRQLVYSFQLLEPINLFAHPEGLWEITYPASWTVNGPTWTVGSLPESGLERVGFIAKDAAGFVGALSVERITPTLPLKMFSEFMLDRMSSETRQLISTKDVTVGGYPAREAVYLDQVNSAIVVYIEMHLVAGAEGYRIRGLTGVKQWFDNETAFRHFVYSFRPLGSPPPPVTPAITPTSEPLPPLPSGQTEPVMLEKSYDEMKFVIRRLNGERWLLRAKTFCAILASYKGSIMEVEFGYVATTITVPNGETCETWTEKKL